MSFSEQYLWILTLRVLPRFDGILVRLIPSVGDFQRFLEYHVVRLWFSLFKFSKFFFYHKYFYFRKCTIVCHFKAGGFLFHNRVSFLTFTYK